MQLANTLIKILCFSPKNAFFLEPPGTPRNLHVISKGSRFVRFGWMLSQQGNYSPILRFIVNFKVRSGMRISIYEIWRIIFEKQFT